MTTLDQAFVQLYDKFKLQFYQKIFSRFEEKEASLTAVETFCVEAIHAMGTPTITEFARFVEISPANAAYKIQSLIKKGYVVKHQSETDRREYSLDVTDKFYRYYGVTSDYMTEVTSRVKEHFTPEELRIFEYMLDTICNQLMPEVDMMKHRSAASDA